MVNQRLIDYIQSEEAQGYTAQQLYSSLIQEGYAPNDVNEAMNIASQALSQVDQTAGPMKKPVNIFLMIIIGVVVIGSIGGGIFFFTYLNDNLEPGTEMNNENVSTDNGTGQAPEVDKLDGEVTEQPEVTLSGCDAFPDKLDSCEPFSCEFEHPFTGESMEKRIIGFVDDKCRYTEEMPNDGRLDCDYSESLRIAVAQYHRDLAAAESFGTGIRAGLEGGDAEITYMIDGKEVENPSQEAMDTGQCAISGYDIPDSGSECPPGTEYKGETYTYEHGEQIAHTICSDMGIICPPCENCVSGTTKKVLSATGEVCFECQSDNDCRGGFHCFDHSCLGNDVLSDNPESCEGFDGYVPNDPCQEYSCEACEKGHKVCNSGWDSWSSDMKYKCIECDDSFNGCIDGYDCEEYVCVISSNTVTEEQAESIVKRLIYLGIIYTGNTYADEDELNELKLDIETQEDSYVVTLDIGMILTIDQETGIIYCIENQGQEVCDEAYMTYLDGGIIIDTASFSCTPGEAAAADDSGMNCHQEIIDKYYSLKEQLVSRR